MRKSPKISPGEGRPTGRSFPPAAPALDGRAQWSLPELVERAQAGDRAAFARLYEHFGPVVHAVLLCRVRPQEADDLVQEVFLNALGRLQSVENPADVGAWLCAIARNRARDWWRARARLESSLEENVLEPAFMDEGGSNSDEASHALAAVRQLPEAYRETLLMRLVEGLSGPEIAARTGLTHGSVRVNLHRGMELLREKLAREPS